MLFASTSIIASLSVIYALSSVKAHRPLESFVMKVISTLMAIAVTVLLSACSNPVTYDSDYKSSVDFKELRTFAWHAPNEFNESSKAYVANDMVDERIRSNVDKELQAKGFVKKASGDVDFYVNYSITTEDKVDIRTYNTYSGYGHGYGYGGYGYPYRYGGIGYMHIQPDVETKVTQYTQGTFVLDIIKGSSDKLIWRGTAEGRMKNESLTPDEKKERVAEIVNKVLSAYPPQ